VGAPFSKKSTTVFTPRPGRCAGAVKHGIEVAVFQEEFSQTHGCVVGVREKRVLDDHAATAPGLEHLDEVLEEQECRLARADGKVLLHFLAFLAAEGRIGHHYVDAVFVLNVGEVSVRCWCG